MERNQNPQIILESCDKQLLGLICAKIRSFRMPEPYKGKGILFKGEVIRRKSGKIRSFRMPEPYKGKGILFKGEVIRRKSGKSAAAK